MRGAGSSADSRARMTAQGGWDVADEQRFWESLGVWGAINSDGGEVAQLAAIDPDRRYDVFPAAWASPVDCIPSQSLTEAIPAARNVASEPPYPSQTRALPAGGTLMYFYIRDIGTDLRTNRPAEIIRQSR